MLGKRPKSRIVDHADPSTVLQELGERLRGPRLNLHPEGERFESPADEERLERTEGRPEHLVHEPNAIEQTSLRCDDGSRDHVAVAPEVFCRAVQHAVDPELDRPLVHRRSEGVVGEGGGAHGLGRRHGLGEVRDHHRRIRRGLNVDQTGVGTDRLFPRPASARIHEGRFDPEAREQSREDLRRSGIEARAGDDVIAAVDGGEDRGRNRAHPRSGRQRTGASLEVRERVLEFPHRRIAPPRVVRRRRGLDREVRALPGRRQGPCGARKNRGHEGTGLSATRTVDRAGPCAPALSHGGGTARASEIRFEFFRSGEPEDRASLERRRNKTGKVKKGRGIQANARP